MWQHGMADAALALGVAVQVGRHDVVVVVCKKFSSIFVHVWAYLLARVEVTCAGGDCYMCSGATLRRLTS